MKKLSIALALCLLLVPAAFANSVTSANGGAFSLDVQNVSGNTYQITYTADFSQSGAFAWTGGSLYINGLDFGFNSKAPIGTPTLISQTDTANWGNAYQGTGPLTGGGLGTNGCNVGSSNFACFQLGLNGAPANEYLLDPTTGIYTWKWDVTYGSPLVASDFLAANDHIGMLFVNVDGSSRGILSTGIDITPPEERKVSEPGSLLLLGTGFLSAAGLFRRKRLV
jgi:PEP-CTERM motif